MKQFFLYRKTDNDSNCAIEMDSCLIAKYVTLYQPMDYEINYFKSTSPLLNQKYRIEMNPKSAINDFLTKVVDFEPEQKEYDGVKVTLYVNEDDYEAKICGAFDSCYIILFDSDEKGVTQDDFVKEAVKQYRLIKKVLKDKTFEDPRYTWNSEEGY
ncbi:MAG: hypothetical protein ACI4W6_05455 [Acutalibacteraceae bacterium]